MKPLVSIIVVSHEHKKYLRACFSSVFRQKGVSFEVILVDNASRDGTVEYVKHSFPQAELIVKKTRDGFAANVNIGIQNSVGKYFLVLNPDTLMFKGALLGLVRRMESDKKIGICGPQLVNPDGTIQLSFRNFPTWQTAIFRRTPLRLLFPNAQIVQKHLNKGKNHKIAKKVDWMLGACLLFRRSMLEEIGYLDAGYRLYVEDIDICLRACKAGWDVWYEPKAIVLHHHEAKSDHALVSRHSYYHALSMMRYAAKYWW